MKVNNSLISNVLAGAITISVLSGCVAYGGTTSGPYPQHYPAGDFEIPAGHMPPPGECRIWFPDRPPGQQPPPGKCYDLERRVPPGAFLVHG